MKKGREIYEQYRKSGGEYAQTLGTILMNIGDDMFSMLEDAENSGKQLKIDMPDNVLWDEFTKDNVIAV